MGKLNIVVLGDGILGSEIVKQIGCEYISRKKDNFNIDDESTWNFSNYEIVINCIANTDTYSRKKDDHWKVNYEFVNNLINYCNTHSIKLIHISTEYLYSGSVDNASETDVPVHCNNWYGYTKLLGDGLVQLLSKNYLIFRCMHKPSPFPYNKSWIDQIGNFDYVDKIAELMIRIIERDVTGVYNIGTELKSIYDLAVKTNPNAEPSLALESVPKNISMSVSKMKRDLSKSNFFTIAIPTYEYSGKGSTFLEYSFSILERQTFKDFNVVISDHSLNSDIYDICTKWKNRLNISYIKNDIGRGVISPNINVCLKNSTGKYIKVLFQDDFLLNENSLRITHDFIKLNENVKWIMTAFYHSIDGYELSRPMVPSWNDLIWTGNNSMGCPTGMTIKNENLIFFDEQLNWLMDVDYYKRMFDLYGKPHILNSYTVVNRTWGERLTDTISHEVKVREFKIVRDKYEKPS